MKVEELSVVSLGWFCATRAKKAKLDTKVGRLLLKRNLNVDITQRRFFRVDAESNYRSAEFTKFLADRFYAIETPLD